jgi:hypothetical protein
MSTPSFPRGPSGAQCFLLTLIAAMSMGCSVEGVDSLFGNDGADGSAGGRGQGGAPMQTTTTGTTDTSSATGNPDTSSTDTGGPVTSTTDATTTGPEPEGPTVFCADLPCAEGEICCYYQFAINKDFCDQPGECPDFNGWVELHCNGPDDCPNAECCGTWTPETGWAGSKCGQGCEGDDQFELCFGDPTACDPGMVCQPSQSLGVGYSFCDS